MSYDIDAFRVPPGRAADERAEMEGRSAYARVLNQTGGFTISDPQTGAIVDLDALDLDGVARVYARGVHVVRDIAEQPKRPWWKLRRS